MPKRYGQSCPVAKTLELIGDRWTLLIVRDLLPGTRRFQDLLSSLSGIAPNILSDRLKLMEEHALVSRRLYSSIRPCRKTKWRGPRRATLACDLFLVLGSSLVGLSRRRAFPLLAKRNGARLVILNREETEQDPYADLVMHSEIGPTMRAAVNAL